MGRVAALLKRLEVRPTDDEYETIETDRGGNRDVYPVAHDKRTYGVYAYVSYWGEYSDLSFGLICCFRWIWLCILFL
jgi:cytosine/uracil/thiamine/allantoin permease